MIKTAVPFNCNICLFMLFYIPYPKRLVL